MSLYTLRGSAKLDARIDADMKRIAAVAAPHSLAGVLIGGYGRGEGTPFIQTDGSQAPFNDYDLVVIVNNLNRRVLRKFQSMEKKLSGELGLPVDLYPCRKTALPRLEFSLLNYEMKYGHTVIWGDHNILDAVPNYPHKAIPLSEGTRLLLNRGKLLLDIKRRLAEPHPLTEEERIRFIKFLHKVLLAFGDSALLDAGRYGILYAEKETRAGDIGAVPCRDDIIAGYLSAIELKEWGDYRALHDFDVEKEFSRIVPIYIDFMLWYLGRHDIRECSISKAIALNLRWNKSFRTRHPRELLYQAIVDLLQDQSDISHEHFYTLQRRFS